MWNDLPQENKDEYKKMILAFAGLTEMFAQKAEDNPDKILTPIVNSKYQETVFARVFNAFQEDVGNTSFDASLSQKNDKGEIKYYLIGIKTFGFGTNSQKIAQFKTNIKDWSDIISQITNNAVDEFGNPRTREEINKLNNDLYQSLATKISILRNIRIESSIANLHGFSITDNDKKNVESVYHVLMPSLLNDLIPVIYVGETSYQQIRIENLTVSGCKSPKTPANFEFSDGNHNYRFTFADSQLYMDFNNKNIIQDTWEVKYADDAYIIFRDIADKINNSGKSKIFYGNADLGKFKIHANHIVESHCWKIARKNNEVELFSGYNSFYGVGSKLAKGTRKDVINRLRLKYQSVLKKDLLDNLINGLTSYLLAPSGNLEEKMNKVVLRNSIVSLILIINIRELTEDVLKLVYRPRNEMYIPIPNSLVFHKQFPNFFTKNLGSFSSDLTSLELSPDKKLREFNLVFEPSGDSIRSFITQSSGKGIESVEKQSYLGDWILRGIFQLSEYEPLTSQKLDDVGINGIRLYKTNNSDDVHLQFIWLDDENLPNDYFE